MFQIIEALPTYCQITDAIIGTHYVRHPMTYFREDSARAIAAMRYQQNYDCCGDSSFFVVEAGASVLRPLPAPAMEDAFGEYPF